MPMFRVTRAATGICTKTFYVVADTEAEAQERSYSREPDDQYFKPHEVNVRVKALDDCKCTICLDRYPWACKHAEPADYIIELGGQAFG